MVNGLSRKSLQSQIDKEKAKISVANEKARLRSELADLKRSQKPSVIRVRRAIALVTPSVKRLGKGLAAARQRIIDEQRRGIAKSKPRIRKRIRVRPRRGLTTRELLDRDVVEKRISGRRRRPTITRRRRRVVRPVRKKEQKEFNVFDFDF